MALPYFHMAVLTSCCGVHEVCGADCDGGYETLCKECGDPCCSKCAASFEAEERVTAVCKDCAAEEALNAR